MIRVYQMPSKSMEATNSYSFMYDKDGLFDLDTNIQYYEHVANLDTNDLNEAFKIGNIGPEDKYTRFKKMRSVSVGDILVNDNNDTFVVASFGFDQIQPQWMLKVSEVA